LVAVFYADMPLLRPETLQRLIEASSRIGSGHASDRRIARSAWFGRNRRGDDRAVTGIVEERDVRQINC